LETVEKKKVGFGGKDKEPGVLQKDHPALAWLPEFSDVFCPGKGRGLLGKETILPHGLRKGRNLETKGAEMISKAECKIPKIVKGNNSKRKRANEK